MGTPVRPYTPHIPAYLHRLSAILFYLLGGSMFAAYALRAHGIWPYATEQWMLAAMLPLLLCGLLYGMLSLYLGVRGTSGKSTLLATALALLSILVFSAFAALTFLPRS